MNLGQGDTQPGEDLDNVDTTIHESTNVQSRSARQRHLEKPPTEVTLTWGAQWESRHWSGR